MSEIILYFLWKYQIFTVTQLYTVNKEIIEVINPGTQNTDAGPDFFNAKIRINQTILAGNIEIHIKNSDWMIHKHHLQPNYSNIILHVVFEFDKEINHPIYIPVLELKSIISPEVINKYQLLILKNNKNICHNNLSLISTHYLYQNWLCRLGIERLQRKSDEILNQFNYFSNNVIELFYIQLAKCFGLKINALPFEMLAKSIPLNILLKHHDSLFQIEAILFGNANLIPEDTDDYIVDLKKEYQHLSHKYKLVPIDIEWKFLRTRPANFPHFRLAQFAQIIKNINTIFNEITNSTNLYHIYFPDLAPSLYWQNFSSCKKSNSNIKKNNPSILIQNIYINAIVPILLAMDNFTCQQNYSSKIIDLLETLPYEENKITRLFKSNNIKCQNALQSQGLIELQNQYCEQKKCLNCEFGLITFKPNNSSIINIVSEEFSEYI